VSADAGRIFGQAVHAGLRIKKIYAVNEQTLEELSDERDVIRRG